MSTKPLLSLAELQTELTDWRNHRQPRSSRGLSH